MSHASAPASLVHGHPINLRSSAKFVYASSPNRFMPEHPNSSEQGGGKAVLTGSNRNKVRTGQVETVLPAVLLSPDHTAAGLCRTCLWATEGSWKEGGRDRFCPHGDAEIVA